MSWLAVAWLGAVILMAGCDVKGERCRKCGMRVEDHPRWIAGLTTDSGATERFCSPRCLFAHWRSERGAGARHAWVTEYYTQKPTPVNEVLFVAGSDVIGPMGTALVPIAGRAAAEQFLGDHHGTRLVSADEITVEFLRGLAAKPARPTTED